MANERKSQFVRPQFSPRYSAPPEGTDSGDLWCSSLSELLSFNAQRNKNHLFCLQAEVKQHDESTSSEHDTGYNVREITYGQLFSAVNRCSAWMSCRLERFPRSPVALYIESDIGLFIYLAALLTSDVPVLIISIRLSSSNVRNLLLETKSSKLLVSKRTRKLLEEEIEGISEVIEAESWQSFLDVSNESQWSKGRAENCLGKSAKLVSDVDGDGRKPGSLILHSSGTTGCPKAIYLSQRYPLGYAACHEMGENEPIGRNLSTLPLYHGFGFLAPCLSLSIGMTCCLPPSKIIPAAKSTMELLQIFEAKSLMTVPSVVDDIIFLKEFSRRDAIQDLKRLDFLAVGGGPLAAEKGQYLKNEGIKLVNHYGATEICSLAPIFIPEPDYDCSYVRLRADLDLKLGQIAGSNKFKIYCKPIDEDTEFEIQDEVERKPNSDREVRVIGRTDDLIVLKSGEKFMPKNLEDAIMSSSLVQTAVCVGNGRFEIAVLVEPSPNASCTPETVRDQVWEQVLELNPTLDQHGRIYTKEAIIIKDAGKPFPRSDKGSIMRREVMQIFEGEIEATYAKLESVPANIKFDLDRENLASSIARILAAVSGREMMNELQRHEDFFENGMDSLQAVRLARIIHQAMKQHRPNEKTSEPIAAQFVYQHPTIEKLSMALKYQLSTSLESAIVQSSRDRSREMNIFLARFLRQRPTSLASKLRQRPTSLASKLRQRPTSLASKMSHVRGYVILLTGATGNLGVHVLSCLARSSQVGRVICLVRRKHNDHLPSRRVKESLQAAGLSLESNEWAKVEFRITDEVLRQDSPGAWDEVAAEISHIIHLAWPMDFHRGLESFRPQLRELCNLVDLAKEAHIQKPWLRVRLLFASSIAAVRNYAEIGGKSRATVPETEMEDPLVTASMGYAEAKWACERILADARRYESAQLDPIVVRIGQLSGPEHNTASWSTSEHIPVLIKASQTVGSFPSLEGTVSWLPVDAAARCLVEMAFHKGNLGGFLHLENPVRQQMTDIFAIMAPQLGLPTNSTISFDQWLQRASKAEALGSLDDFFLHHFQHLATGSLQLETTRSRSVSRTLCECGGLSSEMLVEYIKRWQKEGFLFI